MNYSSLSEFYDEYRRIARTGVAFGKKVNRVWSKYVKGNKIRLTIISDTLAENGVISELVFAWEMKLRQRYLESVNLGLGRRSEKIRVTIENIKRESLSADFVFYFPEPLNIRSRRLTRKYELLYQASSGVNDLIYSLEGNNTRDEERYIRDVIDTDDRSYRQIHQLIKDHFYLALNENPISQNTLEKVDLQILKAAAVFRPGLKYEYRKASSNNRFNWY